MNKELGSTDGELRVFEPGESFELIRSKLEDVLELERERYGVAPAISLSREGFSGFAVTIAQLNRIEKQLGILTGLGVLKSVENSEATRAWLGVTAKQNIYASPFTDKLATQSLPGDPALRALKMSGVNGRILVQSFDRSLGWIMESETVAADEVQVKAFFDCIELMPKQVYRCSTDSVLAICEEARALASQAVPYLLGGSDIAASIDCSALILRLYHKHTGLTLPRHSSEQRRIGTVVHTGEEQAGDLLFATTRKGRLSHVVLVVDPPGENQCVVHACLSKGKVLHEPMTQFYECYQRRSARRIWEPQ